MPPARPTRAVRRRAAQKGWTPRLAGTCGVPGVLRLSAPSPRPYRVTVPVNVERTGELGFGPYTASPFPLPLSRPAPVLTTGGTDGIHLQARSEDRTT